MAKFREDKFGKWEIRKGDEVLIEPSREYLKEMEKERAKRLEEQKKFEEKAKRRKELKKKFFAKKGTLEDIQEFLVDLS